MDTVSRFNGVWQGQTHIHIRIRIHTCTTCTRRVAGFHTGVSRSHSCLTAAANAGHDVCFEGRGVSGMKAIEGMVETKR